MVDFGKAVRLAYTMKCDRLYERRYHSTGSGQFYTHEDPERMHVYDSMDVLRRVPFLRVQDDAGQSALTFPDRGMRGIYIAIDGHRV